MESLTDSGLQARFQTTKFGDKVTEIVRQLILSEEIAPGERLNEVALSERLGISRSPIREALNALAGQGLVRFIPGKGAFVPKFTVEEVDDLSTVRQVLECLAARLAAENADKLQLEAIEQVVSLTDSSLRGDSTMYPHELDFHELVLQASGNAALEQLTTTVITQLRIARFSSSRIPGRAEEAHEEHQAILQALSDRDPDAAASAMEKHLRNAQFNIRDVVKADEQPPDQVEANVPQA